MFSQCDSPQGPALYHDPWALVSPGNFPWKMKVMILFSHNGHIHIALQLPPMFIWQAVWAACHCGHWRLVRTELVRSAVVWLQFCVCLSITYRKLRYTDSCGGL